MRFLLILILGLCPALAVAEDLRKGRYLVTIEAGDLQEGSAPEQIEKQICWRGAGHAQMSLGPMALGSLAHCAGTARSTEGGVEVSTKCSDPEIGRVLTRYRRTQNGFRGWVTANMDGPNRSVIERQSGRWIGRC